MPLPSYSLLPLLAALLLALCLYRRSGEIRLSLAAAAVLWSAFLIAASELLSLPRLLNHTAVTLLWTSAVLALLLLLRRQPRPPVPLWQRTRQAFNTLDPLERAIAAILALFALLIGATALLTPPNTWDVTSYHLTRVMMWLQNGSLAFFPAPFTHNLHQPPANEILQLHFVLLDSNDLLANTTQWFAWLGCLLTASHIVQLLGGTRRAAWAAALLAGTLPQVVLVASGSKNDVSASLWMLCFVLFGLLYRERPRWQTALLMGLAAALELLTKGAHYAFLPAAACAVAALWPRPVWRRFLTHAPAAALALLLLAPHAARNVAQFGHPLAPPAPSPEAPESFTVSHFTPGRMAANVIRNFALATNFGSPAHAQAATRLWRRLLTALGQDPDDPEALFCCRFQSEPFVWDEIWMGNSVLLVFYLGVLFWSLARPARAGREILVFALAAAAGFLLFSILIRWSPWHTRLHQPAYYLALLPCALLAGRWGRRSLALLTLLCLPLALYSAIHNDIRPLRGKPSILSSTREFDYFRDRSWDRDDTLAVIAALRQSPCRRIGLEHGHEFLDYPYFALLGVARHQREIRFVRVENNTARLAAPYDPCAVICHGCAAADSAERLPERRSWYLAHGYSERRFGRQLLFVKP